MRQKEAMMTVVVATFILTATGHAAARPGAGADTGNPSCELIDLTPDHGIMPYPIGSDVGSPFASNANTAVAATPFAVDSGVLMSNLHGWPQSYKLLDLAAVQSTGFETSGSPGAPVPEQATVAMLVAGLAVLAAAARRRARHAF